MQHSSLPWNERSARGDPGAGGQLAVRCIDHDLGEPEGGTLVGCKACHCRGRDIDDCALHPSGAGTSQGGIAPAAKCDAAPAGQRGGSEPLGKVRDAATPVQRAGFKQSAVEKQTQVGSGYGWRAVYRCGGG